MATHFQRIKRQPFNLSSALNLAYETEFLISVFSLTLRECRKCFRVVLKKLAEFTDNLVFKGFYILKDINSFK